MRTSSERAALAAASSIRAMQALAVRAHGDRAIDLAAGFPEFPAPRAAIAAAATALDGDGRQYAPPVGLPSLRAAIARSEGARWSAAIDPETEVTVCCGTTEGVMAALLATIDQGDEVIVPTPCYENYLGDVVLGGGTPRLVPLRTPGWRLDPEALASAFTRRTRAIVLNSPHNPTGSALTDAELALVADLCCRHDVTAICDEVYDHFGYERPAVSLGTLPPMRERTIAVRGASKTFAVPGWRVGWVIAAAERTEAIRRVHDRLSLGSARPLQVGVEAALSVPREYHEAMRTELRERRDLLVAGLRAIGFRVDRPEAGFFALAGIEPLGFATDVQAAEHLAGEVGVSSVPVSLMDAGPAQELASLRFAFSRRREALVEALDRMAVALRGGAPGARGTPRPVTWS